MSYNYEGLGEMFEGNFADTWCAGKQLGVKKAEESAVTYSKHSRQCTVGPSSSSNSETESGTNIGQHAKLSVQAKEDGTPFHKDETPLAKHARLTHLSSWAQVHCYSH